MKATAIPMPKWPETIHVSANDNNLNEETELIGSESKEDSLVYYWRGYGL